ncbi:hypothetical protein G5B39_18370 (plasmid) [Rhodobacteraceae bacterium SC52]|nr:hypothetical protein G5B39_18370 [Rhodobacteraceae bacterium SC52]
MTNAISIALAASLSFLTLSSASAATVGTEIDPSADWDVTCADERTCTVSRAVLNADTGERIATFALEFGEDTQAMTLTVPLGTAVQAGVRVLAGDTAIDVPTLVCLPTGCLAARDLPDEAVTHLTAARTIDIRFFAFKKSEPLSVAMDITALSDVLREKISWRKEWAE